MSSTYHDLITGSYEFPQDGFDREDGYLTFNDVSLSKLIKKYGTPFKLIYLPKIASQIRNAREFFHKAMKAHKYNAEYFFCYCTKSNHFDYALHATLKENVQLETSSAFDIELVKLLSEDDRIDRDIVLIHNGYKTSAYIDGILSLHHSGFHNAITVLDSKNEFLRFAKMAPENLKELNIGIRIAIDEEPQSPYFTSRLGVNPDEILSLYTEQIKGDERFILKMVHFFIDTGIKDTIYYWREFRKALQVFVSLKKICPDIDSLNIGGGFPIQNSLDFQYDYQCMADQIILTIKDICDREDVEVPDIYTEFGKYTVGEAGAVVFEVLDQKVQNSREKWYLLDNSLLNTIPDTWSISEEYMLLAINKWDRAYEIVHLGGISCDHSDHYNPEDMNKHSVLPSLAETEEEPLYIGFFHTAAYQDAISGYGGIKHCLIPSPKVIIVDKDEDGGLTDYLYREEQSSQDMLRILGYNR